jgi:hypothetical protein
MTEEDFRELSDYRFTPSRIPKLDALATFVALGGESDPTVQAAMQVTGFSRWFPVEGGHRVLVPYEGGDYDSKRFSLESEAWDHETCHVCRCHIDAMQLCWVTASGPYVLLCEGCHAEFAAMNLRT